PDLPRPVDSVVLPVHTVDLAGQVRITPLTIGRAAAHMLVVGRRGNLAAVLGEHRTDRLDAPEEATVVLVVLVLADKVHDHACGRSSSAAKKDEAAFKMPFARLSSAFSRRS